MAMKFLKSFALILFFVAAVILFLPKKSLYYYAEEKLERFKTVIANEAIKEGPFSLHLLHADIYIEGIRAAKVMDIDLKTYGLSTLVEAERLRLSGAAGSFLPTKIETLRVRYALWNPLQITFNAEGEFGTAEGSYLITEHKLLLLLHPSKMMQSRYRDILRRMKKNKNGGYSYEQRL